MLLQFSLSAPTALAAQVPYLSAIAILVGLGVLSGIALYIGSRAFAVEVDPRVDQVAEVLSGANCGACSFGGCRAYAEAVVTKGVSTGLCAPGGQAVCEAVSRIMGTAAVATEKRVAVVHCQGAPGRTRTRGSYSGIADCRAALVPGAAGGAKSCPQGCLGLGTCARACPFEAMVMGPDGLPLVIERNCTACGRCVEACPRGLLSLHGRGQGIFVLCRQRQRGKATRDACDVGCIACKRCEKACTSGAIKVVDNCAVIDDAKCTQCGECVKVCPRGIIWDLRAARESYRLVAAAPAACQGADE